jgi:DNA-binding PadR family transcriptional regulator
MRDFRKMHEERMRGFGFGWRGQFPFPGPGHQGHRGRGRQWGGRRGNVRAAILALLTERPMHGYEMIKEIDTRTGGVWSPSPGSVYPTLQLLEDEGLITSEESGGRKRFTLTEAAQAEATAAAADAPWNEFSAETVASGQDTKEAIFGIMNALRQIGFEGTPEQWQRAVAVLQETKRKLYGILAHDE